MISYRNKSMIMEMLVMSLIMGIISTNSISISAEVSHISSFLRTKNGRYRLNFNDNDTMYYDRNDVEYEPRPWITAQQQERLDQRRMDRAVADDIRHRVRVLCWVMTYPDSRIKNAIHIKKTWGKRCDILLFLSTVEDLHLPTVKLLFPDGRQFLWGKAQVSLRYIYDNFLNAAEWFIRVDDDTYVIVENLKNILVDYNANDPIYFGSRLQSPLTKDSFVSSGAGYVLSREAVSRFVVQGLNSGVCELTPWGEEDDLDLSICLDKLGVVPMDSRDFYLRERFFPFLPNRHVMAVVKRDHWHWKWTYYPVSSGRDCCSEYAISFHCGHADLMYAMEYFVYHLRPYGISYEYHQIYN